MLDPEVRAVFSAQGRAYAEAAYGSTDGFIERVLSVAGSVAGDAVPGIGGAWAIGGNGRTAAAAADTGRSAGVSITA